MTEKVRGNCKEIVKIEIIYSGPKYRRQKMIKTVNMIRHDFIKNNFYQLNYILDVARGYHYRNLCSTFS